MSDIPNANDRGRLSSLLITEQERKMVVEKLVKEFGPAVKEGMKNGQHIPLSAAALLYGFASDPGWKGSKSK
ncbi:MAG: hypothetical protein FJW37_10105 [Acidobacteria bacterium]|nr:hypothetical protein [Acidobacteriota bacterium]